MKKQTKYDNVIGKVESIFSGKLKLSTQARMSLVSSILHMEYR